MKRKTDPARMATVLYVDGRSAARRRHHGAAVSCRAPPAKLLDLLGVAPDARDFAHVGAGGIAWRRDGAARALARLPALCRNLSRDDRRKCPLTSTLPSRSTETA